MGHLVKPYHRRYYSWYSSWYYSLRNRLNLIKIWLVSRDAVFLIIAWVKPLISLASFGFFPGIFMRYPWLIPRVPRFFFLYFPLICCGSLEGSSRWCGVHRPPVPRSRSPKRAPPIHLLGYSSTTEGRG